MTPRDRRDFLKQSAVAVSAIGLGGCRPEDGDAGPGAATPAPRALDPVVLAALAEAVLPAELGASGRQAATEAFTEWLAGYEPAAERPHPYLTPDISYGPPDPAPGWNAQLAALDLEAVRRIGRPFAELDASERRPLIRGQIGSEGPDLPDPARARHVAVGLLAHFYASSSANDACYGARIGKDLCRGLDSLEGAPPPERVARYRARDDSSEREGRPS